MVVAAAAFNKTKKHMFFKKKENKTKTFGDLKKGNSAWRLMSDISSDKPYLIEVVYQGKAMSN